MKSLNTNEAKKELIKMLDYFDSVCRKNNIKYSLIGGSMIGAIRHKGMIPWDDDIDIILDYNNYLLLLDAFKRETREDYKLYNYETSNSFFFPFSKMINTNTYAVENTEHPSIDDYGLFIDIFTYNYTSNNCIFRGIHFKKIKAINSLLSLTNPNANNISFKIKLLRKMKLFISNMIGTKLLHKIQSKIINKYNKRSKKTKYVVSNWPVYGYKKEIQDSKNIEKYIDINFDGINTMIYKEYDNILKTTFGEYMKMPPLDERINHGIKVYWKEKNEKEKISL